MEASGCRCVFELDVFRFYVAFYVTFLSLFILGNWRSYYVKNREPGPSLTNTCNVNNELLLGFKKDKFISLLDIHVRIDCFLQVFCGDKRQEMAFVPKSNLCLSGICWDSQILRVIISILRNELFQSIFKLILFTLSNCTLLVELLTNYFIRSSINWEASGYARTIQDR